jgi:pectin methylesterase-like acyl-CoA thioesterase
MVAADGSDNFKTIDVAIAVAPLKSSKSHVIHIKSGIYSELVMIEKPSTTFMGDDMDPNQSRVATATPMAITHRIRP